jgi:hypothetical protein
VQQDTKRRQHHRAAGAKPRPYVRVGRSGENRLPRGSVSEAGIRDFRALPGQVSELRPQVIARWCPLPSWSVLERLTVTSSPRSVSLTSATSSVTSSRRRVAEANPNSDRARSRMALRESPPA